MTSIIIRISSRSLIKGINQLDKQFGRRRVQKSLRIVAENVLAKARRRAPSRFGVLRDSGTWKNGFFGFNQPHAAVMDAGWNVGRIVPVRAQALFIPLTRSAARSGPSGGSATRRRRRRQPLGLPGSGRATRALRRSRKPFIFAKSVKPRKVQKFAKKGPNLYFSETVKDEVSSGRILKDMGVVVQSLISKGVPR